ncbi:hypothetical protein AAMO2058_000717300 [Amorphochlora amoebiformis]
MSDDELPDFDIDEIPDDIKIEASASGVPPMNPEPTPTPAPNLASKMMAEQRLQLLLQRQQQQAAAQAAQAAAQVQSVATTAATATAGDTTHTAAATKASPPVGGATREEKLLYSMFHLEQKTIAQSNANIIDVLRLMGRLSNPVSVVQKAIMYYDDEEIRHFTPKPSTHQTSPHIDLSGPTPPQGAQVGAKSSSNGQNVNNMSASSASAAGKSGTPAQMLSSSTVPSAALQPSSSTTPANNITTTNKLLWGNNSAASRSSGGITGVTALTPGVSGMDMGAERARRKAEEEAREKRELEEDRKSAIRLFDERTARYDRKSGIPHSQVMAEQQYVKLDTVQRMVSRHCRDAGLVEPDLKADHQVFECLSQAVQKLLTDTIEGMVRISRHRESTTRLRGDRNDCILYKGDIIKVEVDNLKPKWVLAIQRRKKEERDDDMMIEKAAQARKEADSEELKGIEDPASERAREEANAAAAQFSGAPKPLIARKKKKKMPKPISAEAFSTGTRAYLARRGGEGGGGEHDLDLDMEIDGRGEGESSKRKGCVAVGDFLGYLEKFPVVNRGLANLLHRSYLTLRYESPNEEQRKMLQMLKSQIEAKAKLRISSLSCLGVLTIGSAYFFRTLVDNVHQYNVTIRANEVIDASRTSWQ